MNFVTAFKNRSGAYVEVFINPSSKRELRKIESWKEYGSVRGLLTESGDLFYWDTRALHPEVQMSLNLKEEIIPIIIGDNYIYITESIKSSFGSEDIKDKFRKGGEIITCHKDKIASVIGKFSIVHYGSDSEENVIAQPFGVRTPKSHWLTLIGLDREKILELSKQIEDNAK